ncbi:D-alanyl-D-alanine carboxypeptidase, partial [Xanthomonas citri pv. citri]
MALMIITATVGVALPAGLAVPAQAAADPKLVAKIDSVLRDSRTTKARTGVVVLDGRSGESLYQRYGTRTVIPASNTKILTAVTAMHVLKPDYRFRTEVIRRAPVV